MGGSVALHFRILTHESGKQNKAGQCQIVSNWHRWCGNVWRWAGHFSIGKVVPQHERGGLAAALYHRVGWSSWAAMQFSGLFVAGNIFPGVCTGPAAASLRDGLTWPSGSWIGDRSALDPNALFP